MDWIYTGVSGPSQADSDSVLEDATVWGGGGDMTQAVEKGIRSITSLSPLPQTLAHSTFTC